jgi:hypothetical protein
MANLREKYQEKLDPHESIVSSVQESEETQAIQIKSHDDKAEEEQFQHELIETIITDNKPVSDDNKKASEEDNLENDDTKYDLESLINKANSLREEIPQLDQKISELAEVRSFLF